MPDNIHPDISPKELRKIEDMKKVSSGNFVVGFHT